MKFSDVKLGDVLIADGGFDCIEEGTELVVMAKRGHLAVRCNMGTHTLDGQVDENGELIGFVRKE